jgi:N-acetylmuramoyl-L-alanine amidase
MASPAKKTIDTIILSAGHSPESPGASAFGKREHELTREYAGALRDALSDAGIPVMMINQSLPLRERIQLMKARKTPRDLAIEIHFNAFNGKAYGTEVFYPMGDVTCLKVSRDILLKTSRTLGLRNRGAKLQNRSARGTLGWVKGGGILIEVCFMDNPEDMSRVTPEAWAQAVVAALRPWTQSGLS